MVGGREDRRGGWFEEGVAGEKINVGSFFENALGLWSDGPPPAPVSAHPGSPDKICLIGVPARRAMVLGTLVPAGQRPLTLAHSPVSGPWKW